MKIDYPSITYLLYKVILQIINNVTIMKLWIKNITNYQAFEKRMGTIGTNVKFGKNVKLSGIDNIHLGNNGHICSGCFIRGEGGLDIRIT